MYVHLDRTFPYFSAPGLKIYGIMKENARNRKASKSGAKAIKLKILYYLMHFSILRLLSFNAALFNKY